MYISWVQSFHQKELGYVTLEKRCSTEHFFKTIGSHFSDDGTDPSILGKLS